MYRLKSKLLACFLVRIGYRQLWGLRLINAGDGLLLRSNYLHSELAPVRGLCIRGASNALLFGQSHAFWKGYRSVDYAYVFDST